MNKEVWKISSYALDILSQYDFPGNVRELENIIQRSVALEQSNIILPESLTLGSFKRRSSVGQSRSRTSPPARAELDSPDDQSGGGGLDEEMAYLEARLLLLALCAVGGKRQTAAELLNTSARSLRYRMVKHGLDSLTLSQLERRCRQVEDKSSRRPAGPLNPPWRPQGLDLEMTLEQAEDFLIEKAIGEAEGNKTRAAEILGITFRSLRYRLARKNNIEPL